MGCLSTKQYTNFKPMHLNISGDKQLLVAFSKHRIYVDTQNSEYLQTSLTCLVKRVASDKCAGAALRPDWHQPEISLHSDSSEYSLSQDTGPGQPGAH